MSESHPPEEPSGEDRSPALGISGVAEFRRFALALGFGAIVLSLLAFLVVIYAPVLEPLLWAIVLAALFFPMHQRILHLVGGRERTAATISTVLTVAVFVVPTTYLLFEFAGQAANLWPEVREQIGGDAFTRIAAWLERSPARPLILRVLPETALPGEAGIEEVMRRAVSGFGELALTQLHALGRSAPARLLDAGVTLLIYFFFLRHGPGWLQAFERALPLEREYASNLLSIAGGTVNAVFRGVVITAAVQAGLATLGFIIAGAPAPMVLGAVTLIASLVPFVGPVAVWLPVSAGLAVTGRPATGVGLALWGMLVVSLVDNFLRPYLIGRGTRLPILWLFLAILGGLKVFGLLGLLLGPAGLSLFLACYRIYTEGRRG